MLERRGPDLAEVFLKSALLVGQARRRNDWLPEHLSQPLNH